MDQIFLIVCSREQSIQSGWVRSSSLCVNDFQHVMDYVNNLHRQIKKSFDNAAGGVMPNFSNATRVIARIHFTIFHALVVRHVDVSLLSSFYLLSLLAAAIVDEMWKFSHAKSSSRISVNVENLSALKPRSTSSYIFFAISSLCAHHFLIKFKLSSLLMQPSHPHTHTSTLVK